MGRSPCCEKVGLKKGPWTPEEDQKLLAYIEEHGHGSWRALPAKAGLERCGKSCRLRWTNYLRPDIKRGKFSMQEEQTIIQLHALLGNRWSAIATHLPKRTDNEIKNYWNTHLKKRLAKMGIDPVTHKPKSDAHALGSGQGHSKIAANLSHMAQWESARLEAEARLVRESKLRSAPLDPSPLLGPAQLSSKPAPMHPPPCLDILRAWHGLGSKPSGGGRIDLESPTSTLSFCENRMAVASLGMTVIDNGNPAMCERGDEEREGVGEAEWKCFGRAVHVPDMVRDRTDGLSLFSADSICGFGTETTAWMQETSAASGGGFTSMLMHNKISEQNFLEGCGESENVDAASSVEEEQQREYWNTILDLVNSTPPSNPPPVF